jgi:hypothetical protein
MPLITSQFYQLEAEKAERTAQSIRFEHEREQMLEIARKWRALERNALRRERQGY